MTLLLLDRVDKIFGGLRALREVSFGVPASSIMGLIGPNGAGKTTLFNVITGVYRPDGGRVVFNGVDVAGWQPARVARVGIARTFQNIRLFRSMTVRENVLVAGHHLHQSSVLDAVLRNLAHRTDERALEHRADELLEVFGLRGLADASAASLPYGSQRRLEIARALMLSPRLLLLDEPAAGMNSQEAQELQGQIRFLRDKLELTVVLVEHNMSVVMGVCEEIHVVDHGETIAHGSPEHIRTHPRVLSAYLGKDDDGGANQAEPGRTEVNHGS